MINRAPLPGTPIPTHRWTGSGGVTIAGDSWGNENDPLVVLLHGAGQTRHAWSEAGLRISEAGFYTIAYDARGHSDSDWAPDGEYSQDAMVADLVALLRSVGQLNPILVGASMGGVTSLISIGEHRVDAKALILVDVAPHIEPGGSAKIQHFMNRHVNGFSSLNEVADAIAEHRPHLPRPESLDGLAKNVRFGSDGRFYWHWDPRTRLNRPDLESREKRLLECTRQLSVPTLLVRGGLSDLLSEDGARSFLRVCKHSEYVNVEGAAHMVAGDRNDIFTEAVISFLLRTQDADRNKMSSRDAEF